jgi:mannose-1-phosphate guanylyltransferase
MPLVPPVRILVVSGKDLREEVMRQLPQIPEMNFLAEPEGRSTAPCIGWAAMHIEHTVGEDVMVVLPSDHFIENENRFRTILKAAISFANSGNHLVTLAIAPTRPETGFGYIELGPSEGTVEYEHVHAVLGFREKPDKETAAQFLKKGTFYWNSGIFIWKTSTILKAIERYLPQVNRGLRDMHTSILAGDQKQAEATFLDLEATSIDYGVMEKASSVNAFLGDFGWSDVGSWSSVYDLNPRDVYTNVVRGELIQIDTRGCLIDSPRKLVATIGLRDMIVVDTEDAILICPRDRAQEVRRIVEMLGVQKKTHLL